MPPLTHAPAMEHLMGHPPTLQSPDHTAAAGSGLPHATWPAVSQLLAARGARGASAWLKTGVRQLRAQPHRQPLLQALRQHPAWARLFARDPRYFHCASSHFIDRRHGMGQRITAMAADLHAAAAALGPALAERIGSGQPLRLWSLNDDVHLQLGLNDCSYHEGLWALSLRDNAGRRLYYVSLSFRDGQAVLVPTLQGPAGGEDDARTVIRTLTKQAEGLRPQALLLAALRAACTAWRVQHLAGIAPEHHVKGRWNLRKNRLHFDYPGFWQEQGGHPAADGHWTLPVVLASRAPEDAPSNKRAMYRRRQALLDAMAADVQRALSGASAPSEALSLAA